MRRLALLVVLLAACGGSDDSAQPEPQPTWGPRECDVVGRYRTCYHGASDGQSLTAIEYRRGSGWVRLPVRHPFHRPGQPKVGHWAWVAESPDGATLLAQWSAECEVPIAFFVPAAGGKPRPVARERYGPATSTALGWTSDGRAIVDLPNSACGGSASRPGVYLIAPDTDDREYWKPAGSVERSLTPRDA